MSLLVPDVGLQQLMRYALGIDSWAAVHVHLFVNNHVPALSDTLGAYTEMGPTDGGGYTDQAFSNSAWVLTTVSDVEIATGPVLTWGFTAATSQIYGVFITDVTDAKLLWAEAFSPSVVFGGAGGTLKYTPVLTLKNA